MPEMVSASTVKEILRLRERAFKAGLWPYAVEIEGNNTLGCSLLGLEVKRADGAGVTVLARPERVGKYQCVAPTRFAEAA